MFQPWPIDFDDTREAAARNLATWAKALRYLGRGDAVGIFSGGTVSTAATPFGQPLDSAWRSFTARMIEWSEATVVPVFFQGHTSRLFQVASHLHVTLRMGLLIREFRTRVGTPVRVVVGDPIPRDRLATFGADGRGMMDFLRRTTYALSPSPIDARRLGTSSTPGTVGRRATGKSWDSWPRLIRRRARPSCPGTPSS